MSPLTTDERIEVDDRERALISDLHTAMTHGAPHWRVLDSLRAAVADDPRLGLDWQPCRRHGCDMWAVASAWAGYCGEDCLEADLAATLRLVEQDDPGYRAAVQRRVDDELTRDEARQRAGHHALADEHPTDWHDAEARP